MNKVLVTGASGFLGRQTLPLLVAKGYDVHAVSRHRLPASDCLGVSWHELDLLAPGGPSRIVQQVRPDSLLHLAWFAAPGLFWEAPENITWVRASIELMQAFADQGGSRLVAAGSCAEYGRTSRECSEDGTPLLPFTLYGTCKCALGNILLSAGGQLNLSSAWGRIFFLYGPHEHPSRLVAYVVRSLLRAEHADCSHGRDVLDFLHVSDAAAAFVALLDSQVRGAVNIGSGRPVAVRQVLEEIGSQIARPELLRFGARESRADPWNIWADTRRLTEEVEWTPRYGLAEGIRQTIEWCRSSSATLA